MSANSQRWRNAILTSAPVARSIASRLYADKARYVAVQIRTGVPWAVIAVIHERESSQDFKTQLGQGDPLDRVSMHVPRGRGPFASWEDGAYDALVNCPPYLARHTDWSIAGTLTALELYNGSGYAARGLPSPYVWAGTNQYRCGKFVRDGVFDASAVDKQIGCAALLKLLIAIDPSADLDRQPRPPPTSVSAHPNALRSSAPVASLWSIFLSAMLALMKRRS